MNMMSRFATALTVLATTAVLITSVASAQAMLRGQKIELVKKSFSRPLVAPRLDAPLAGLCSEITTLQKMNDAYWIGTGYNGTDRSDAPLWAAAGVNGLEALDIMLRHKTAMKERLVNIFEKDLDERAKLGSCAYPTKWGTEEKLVFESSSSVFAAYHEIHFLAGLDMDLRDNSDLDVMRWKRDQDMRKSWTTLNLQKAIAPYADRAKFDKRLDAVREEAKQYNVKLF